MGNRQPEESLEGTDTVTDSIDVDALELIFERDIRGIPWGEEQHGRAYKLCGRLLTALREQQEALQNRVAGDELYTNTRQVFELQAEIARLTKIKDGDTAEFRRMDKALDEFTVENVRLRAVIEEAPCTEAGDECRGTTKELLTACHPDCWKRKALEDSHD